MGILFQKMHQLSTENLQNLLHFSDNFAVNMEPPISIAKEIIAEFVKRERQKVPDSESIVEIPDFGVIAVDKMIGISSTDNVASFHSILDQKSNNSNDNPLNHRVHLELEGPVVMMERDKSKNQADNAVIHYSILVRIEKMNHNFLQNQSCANQMGGIRKGNIYVVLLERIPDNYEVVLSASTMDGGNCKPIGMSLSMINPVVSVQWPYELKTSFRMRAQLQPKDLTVPAQLGLGDEQKVSDEIMSERVLGGTQQMVLMIFNGVRPNGMNGYNGNINGDHIQWPRVQVTSTTTFGDMVDRACPRLGLSLAGQSAQNGVFSGWPQRSVATRYVVRDQIGNRCDDKQLVWKHWHEMMKNQAQIGTLFPVFFFSIASGHNNGQRQRKRQRRSGFNLSSG